MNGTVQYVTSIPQVGKLIEQLEKLTAPVLKRLGVAKPAAPVAEKENVEAGEQ